MSQRACLVDSRSKNLVELLNHHMIGIKIILLITRRNYIDYPLHGKLFDCVRGLIVAKHCEVKRIMRTLVLLFPPSFLGLRPLCYYVFDLPVASATGLLIVSQLSSSLLYLEILP